MRSRILAGVIVGSCLVVVFSGCYSAPVMPPVGLIYNETEAPMALMAKELGSKQGEATATGYFGIVSLGSCSVAAAANAGGITDIKHTDYKFSNILGFQRFTTIVYGD